MSRSVRTAWLDTVDDVLQEISTRRARALVILLAVALSTGALVSSLGISGTARDQIAADIAASALDTITVAAAESARASEPAGVFPDDAEQRVRSLDLVEAAGLGMDLRGSITGATARLPGWPAADVTLLAGTSGYLLASGARLDEVPAWLLDGSEPVALLGRTAADTLDVPCVEDPTGLSIWVDGLALQVLGCIEADDDAISSSVVVPFRLGVERAGSDARAVLLVRTAVGGGPPVSEVLRTAVRPDRPDLLVTSPVVSVESLRHGVSAQLARFVAWVGSLLLTVTALMISNSMISSVATRTAEIGLRRALGASRGQVTRVFVTEGALTGALGGLAGGAIALTAVVVVSVVNAWSVSIDPAWTLLAPALGLVVGVLASIHPAWRASRISPAQAVRND